MKKQIMRQYARLLATKGLNVQKGQEVVITADIDQPEFVAMAVEECYRAGAGKVTVDLDYAPLQKLHIRHRSLKTLSRVEGWEEERLKHYTKVLPARLYIESSDPDGMKGVNMEKAGKAMQARSKIIKPYRDAIDNKFQWCIAAVPGEAWAKKLFPTLRKNQAVEKLWEAILTASRVDDDPVAAWDRHNEDLAARCRYLNDLHIKTLQYTSSNGTDLTVDLMEASQFLGGGEYTLSGVYYNPNIPSEEVFTTPKKDTANGVVYSTKPLSYRGQLIENFSIRFEKGKAVEVHAEKNEDLLKKMISMDEGAAYLGECALIPTHSPINELGITFYNTLFDENASCHLALGRGFIECVKDYSRYTAKECHDMGVNDSMNHEDFMIGSDDMNITAITRDGRKVPIFKNGNWAF